MSIMIEVYRLAYFVLILICWIYFLYLLKTNIPFNNKIENLPPVSIIVPTLNEEKNIERCLKSLTHLDYPNKEIIVVDGGSIDNTVQLSECLADIVILDEELPNDWVGKNHSCYLGYQASKGDYLLFTDADTHHESESLKKTIGLLMNSEAILLSMLPFQKAEKWYEYLISYFFFLSWLVGGSLGQINKKENKHSFMAIGQYMLFKREGYERIGGHFAISSIILEDVAFARLVKDKGEGLLFINSDQLVSCRMYPEGFKSFYQGFHKGIWGGMTTLPVKRKIFSFLWVLYGLFAPIVLIIDMINLRTRESIVILIITILLYFTFGFAFWLNWKDRGDQHLLQYILYPIGLLVIVIIIAKSFFDAITGQDVVWKGRAYDSGFLKYKMKNEK